MGGGLGVVVDKIVSSLEQLKKSSDILSGAESQMLRTFCTSKYMNPNRDLNDPYGRIFMTGDLAAFKRIFNLGSQLFRIAIRQPLRKYSI